MQDDDKQQTAGNYSLVNTEKKEGSKMVIQAEIPPHALVPFKKKALDTLRKTLEIPGFRQGKATDEVVEKHAGTFAVLEKTAGLALAEIYPRILADQEIDAVGQPHISITKLAPDNVLAFTAETAIMPEITLGDYKKLAAEGIKKLSPPDLTATDEEIDKSLLNLRQRLAHSKWHEEHPDEEGHDHGDIKDEDLPALTDELVQTLGAYKNVEEIKAESRRAIETDKAQREHSRRRAAIADAVVAGTPFPIPDVFVDGELGMMLGEFRQTIAHMGLTLDEYLKNIQKTEADLRTEWRGDAEKRARLQLILNRIADAEKLAPQEERLQQEVSHLLEHHKGAKEESVRAYVESVMRNDLVFEFLEGKKAEEKKPEEKK